MGTAWMTTAKLRQARGRSWDDPAQRHEGLAQQAKQAWGELLCPLPWNHYGTLTLKIGGRESQYYLLRTFAKFTGKLQRLAGGHQPRTVLALELQERGTYHAHYLQHFFGPEPARDDAEKLWLELGGGWAAIRDYKATGGAADYCAKYTTKDGLISLHGPWPQLRAHP